MALEIERKFLLASSDWKKEVNQSYPIIQGYLSSNVDRTVRVRILKKKGILTIKGRTQGVTRSEFEYGIPLRDAQHLIELCEQPIIEKIRSEVLIDANLWEIDEFAGLNEGLVVAEIELSDENQVFTLPSWIGKEVSHDPKYYNASLIKKPYLEW